MTRGSIGFPAAICILLGLLTLVMGQFPSRYRDFEPVTGAPAYVAGTTFLAIGLFLYVKERIAGRDKDDA